MAGPAAAAPDCDLGGFEIDGDMPVNCPPGIMDWASVSYASTEQGGTYSSSSKDVDDPSTWTAAGSTPDKADFQKIYSYAQVGADGHYYLYVAWDRTGDSGTGKYAIDLSFAGANVVPTGSGPYPTPQPLHGEGGVVAYINMAGGGAPTLGQLCAYDDQADYPDDVNSDPGDCTTDTSGYASAVSASGTFFEVGFDLTDLAGITPGCPPTEDAATVYMRSITGGSAAGNLKGFTAPLTVTPPSTCGALEVSKVSLNGLTDPSNTSFSYTVDSAAYEVSDALLIGQKDAYAEVDPGTDFTLTESIPAGAPWALSSIVCTLDGTDYVLYANGAPTGTTFPVATAKTTSCVITNATSFLDVSKLTNPVDTEAEFSFTANGSPFVLSGGETTTPFQFAPGTSVTITEADLAGWSLSDIVCTVDGQEVTPTAEDLEAGSVTISTVAGETVNCAFTNDTSFVTVTKQTLPDGSSEVFDFTVDGSPVSLSDGQTSAGFQFEPGTEVTIAETVPDGWDLTDITCTVNGVELDESVTVTTVAATTIDCTFTNRQAGTIIINKSLVGEDDATFEYTGTWLDPQGFEITTENGFGSETFVNIDPGTYTVDELPLEGYDGTTLVCDDSNENGTASTVAGLVGTINLDPGETVECTYTNTQRARLLVDKETVPDEYDQDFDFVFSNGQFETEFTLNDSTDDEAAPWTSGFIVPGTYTVDETVPENWTLTGISCGDRDGDGTTITLAAGQVVTCVFTNTAAPGEVTLTKSVEGVDPSVEWSFDFELIEEPDGTPDLRTVDNSALPASASATWSDLNVGSTYTLIESEVPDGWTVGEIVCNAGAIEDESDDPGFQFVVTPGLTLDCTVTNVASPADVDVEKTVSGVAEGFAWEFDFTIAPVPGGQDATQTTSGVGPDSDVVSWTDLFPGAHYTITEETVPGWEQGVMTCETEEGPLDDLNGDAPGFEFEAEVGVSIDCFVTNRALPVDIDITKSAVGGDGTFEFELQPLDGEGEPVGDPIVESVTTVGGSGVVTFENLTPGSRFSLAETDPGGGWIPGALTCTVTHADQSVEPLDTNDFTIQPGDSISCEIENTARGKIIIVKNVEGDDSTFDFTGTWLDPVEFEITTVGGTGSATFGEVEPGTYSVTEFETPGYDGTMLICDDSDENGTASTVEDLVGTIELDPGETVTCTYTNVQRAEILVDKETIPDEYDQDFEFVFSGGGAPDQPFTLNDASDDEGDLWSSGLIPPGTYSVVETVPDLWTLSGISCGDREGDGTTVTLAAGEVVTCVFTNTAAPGEVTLTKSVEGVDPSLEWSFDFELIEEPDGTPDTRTVDNSAMPGSATVTWSDLNVGSTYTLIESDVPDGWTVGDIVCNAGAIEDESDDPGFQFVVTPGLTLDCTVTNVAAPADVDVEKTVSGVAADFAWEFDFTIAPVPGGQDATQTASGVGPDSDVVSWSDLIPGAHYTITEETVPGWEQGVMTCETEEGPLDDLNGDAPGFEFEAEVGVSIDCFVTNRALPVDIDITKSAVGGDGTFEFELQPLDGEGEPVGDPIVEPVTTVGGSGVVTFENLTPGSRFSLAETDPGGGWIPGALTCTVTHADQSVEPLDTNDFTIQPGDSISCEIENTARGKIIIVKNVEGDDSTFDFTGTWLDPVEFEITTEEGTGQRIFESVDPGTYTVTEQQPVGYDGTMLICTETVVDGEGEPDSTVDGLVGTIELDPGETVTCTYTNTQWGVLIVDKTTIPEADPQEFDFEWSPLEGAPTAFSLADETDPYDTGLIEPGDYVVTETSELPDWVLTGLECVGSSGEPVYDGASATVFVGLQETVVCTFENTKRGPVDIEKVVKPGSVVDHGDGTWSIEYTIEVTSTSFIDEEYDLKDTLRFGGGITPVTAKVVSLDGVTVNPGWNGTTDVVVAEDAIIPAQGLHRYTVSVLAKVAKTVTSAQADCTVGSGESGSGLLNRAEITFWSGSDTSEACAPVKVTPPPAMPATGVGLTALWLGLTLLGAGAVLFTLRRRRIADQG